MLAVSVRVDLAKRDLPRLVGLDHLAAGVLVEVALFVDEQVVLVAPLRIDLAVHVGVDLFANPHLVHVVEHVEFRDAVALGVALLADPPAALEVEPGVAVSVVARIDLFAHEGFVLVVPEPVELSVVVRVLLGAHLLPGLVVDLQVESTAAVRVLLLEGALAIRGVVRPYLGAAVFIPVGPRLGEHAVAEQRDLVRLAVAVGVLLEAHLLASLVVQQEVGFAVPRGVALLGCRAPLRVELDPQVDRSVAVGVLFLADHVRAEEELPQVDLAVVVLVDLDPYRLGVAGVVLPEVDLAVLVLVLLDPEQLLVVVVEVLVGVVERPLCGRRQRSAERTQRQ